MGEPFEGKPSDRPTLMDQIRHEFFRATGNSYEAPLVRVFTTGLVVIALCCAGALALSATTIVIVALGKLMGVW